MAEAVEAACAAMVSWGQQSSNRAMCSDALRWPYSGPSPPTWTPTWSGLDKKTAETKLENPIVRKAIGQGLCGEAASTAGRSPNSRLAAEACSPMTLKRTRPLLACFDKQDDQPGGGRELLHWARISCRGTSSLRDRAKGSGEARAAGGGRAGLHLDRGGPAGRGGKLSGSCGPRSASGRTAGPRRQGPLAAGRQNPASLEPTGLLNLARAQIHEKQWDAAQETCRQLRARTWPQRFGDVEGQVRELEQTIAQGRGQG